MEICWGERNLWMGCKPAPRAPRAPELLGREHPPRTDSAHQGPGAGPAQSRTQSGTQQENRGWQQGRKRVRSRGARVRWKGCRLILEPAASSWQGL